MSHFNRSNVDEGHVSFERNSMLTRQAGFAKERIFDAQITTNANELITDGRAIFRFDTFGDEAFWGDTLQLHKAIEGSNLGGVGPGVCPNTALNLGLQVDVDA